MDKVDPVMESVRTRFEKSGLTLDELGIKMGHPPNSARKSAWQFINQVSDPRISTLRKFAAAVGTTVKRLV